MRALVVAAWALLGAAAAAAQQDERWQVTLNDGRILWDLRLVRFRSDTLVLRGGDSTYRFPVGQVDELRMVRKSVRHQTAQPNRYGGVLSGEDDEVYRLTLFGPSERRGIIERVFKDHPPEPSP